MAQKRSMMENVLCEFENIICCAVIKVFYNKREI